MTDGRRHLVNGKLFDVWRRVVPAIWSCFLIRFGAATFSGPLGGCHLSCGIMDGMYVCQGELCAAQRNPETSTSRSTLMQGAEANKLRSASGAPTPHRSPASLSKNKLGTQWNQFSGDTETQDMGEPTSASPSPSTRPCRSPVSRICSASTRCLGEGGVRYRDPVQGCSPPARCCPRPSQTSALIQELSLCHRLCPTRGHCRTPSGIWHLPDPCSHTRHCGIRENRGQRLGAGQASASTSPKRTAPATATTSARGRGGTDPHDCSAIC